jgi:hypothetical protein
MVNQGVSGEGEEPWQKGDLMPISMPLSVKFVKNCLKNILRLASVLESGHQKPEDPVFMPSIQGLESLHVTFDIGQHKLLVGQCSSPFRCLSMNTKHIEFL